MKKKNKSEVMFWAGILAGIGGGILGNFLVTSAWDISEKGYTYWNTSIYLVTLVLIFGIIFFIDKRLKRLK